MTAEEIRKSSSNLVQKWAALREDGDTLQPVAVQSGIYAALVEIAAQLAELNENCNGMRELMRVFAKAKGLIR
jgi:hypothetical protein